VDGCAADVSSMWPAGRRRGAGRARIERAGGSLEDLQEDLQLAKRLSQLAGYGLAFEYEGFDRHQLTIARHALVVPFVSGDVDADLAHRTLDVGLDDAAEVLQDQPQRVARDRHVPARSRNATSVEFYVKYGSLLIDFVFVIGAAI